MTDVLGSQVTCSIAGTSVICDTNATADNFNPNFTPLVRATGTQNSLVGYYPGLASGGFSLHTDLYPDVLGALLAAAGIPTSGGVITDAGAQAIVLGFAGAGGIGLSAHVNVWEIQVQVGQIPTLRMDFEAVGPPIETSAPSAPTIQQPFFSLDVDPCNLIATTGSTDVTAFTITVTKTNAKKRSFNHSNWPSNVKQSRVEVAVSYTMYNVGPTERGAWIAAMGGCPTVADMLFAFTQQCGLSPAGYSFTVKDCFPDSHKPGGNPDDDIIETFGAKSNSGKMFAVAA